MNQYLEIIELRTTGRNREKLEETFENLVAGLSASSELEQIQVYNNLMLERDFCVHLHVVSENPHSKGSPLGLRIVSILEEFGLVHHNIWCEMPYNKSNHHENINHRSRSLR